MPSTAPKVMASALAAGLLALTMALSLALTSAPARSAETSTPDDTARFLAGLPPAADSPLASLAKSPAWEEHARDFDSIFGQVDKTRLSKVRAFSRERLTDKQRTMLYMFGGPDFLYAVSFFPSATTYVLAGLEPVGQVPQLTALTRPTVDSTFNTIEAPL